MSVKKTPGNLEIPRLYTILTIYDIMIYVLFFYTVYTKHTIIFQHLLCESKKTASLSLNPPGAHPKRDPKVPELWVSGACSTGITLVTL